MSKLVRGGFVVAGVCVIVLVAGVVTAVPAVTAVAGIAALVALSFAVYGWLDEASIGWDGRRRERARKAREDRER